MESTKDKFCPVTGRKCIEAACGWWCGWAKDCAVPLLAGIMADSEICRTKWEEAK